MPKRKLILSALALTVMFIPSRAQTQREGEAGLRVTVVDPSGAAISKAQVRVGRDQVRETGARGEASFSRLTPGAHQIVVTAPGFATREVNLPALKAGDNQVQVALEIAGVQEELWVKQDAREAQTDPRGAAFTRVLTAEQIELLPDDPEEFDLALQALAGPGATFRVNGFRGGKLPPKSQIREIRFRLNPYAAENHESSLIGVDILTKPGLDRWHGALNAGFRDESLNARNAFAPYRAPEQTRRFAFDFGGPLRPGRTSLFLAADGVNAYDTKTIVAALPDGQVNDVVRRPSRTLNVSARLEHALTAGHTLRGEYQRNANRRDNLGVGDFDLPERAYSTDAAENLVRLADSGALGKKLFNETRFQMFWQQTDIRSLSEARTILVLNAFNAGGAQLDSRRRLRELELADNLDFTAGRHTMRAGILFEAAHYQTIERRNYQGTYVFPSLEEFNAGRATTFTRREGVPAVEFTQYQFGWYWQDDVRLRKNLSLSFGLRHELQTNLGDRNNFAPRLGVVWSPFKNGKTTVRAGGGIFYDWFSAGSYEQTLLVNGLRQRDTVVQNPGYPDPFAGGASVVLPPSVYRADPRLRLPYIQQVSVGVERQLPQGIMLRSLYTFQRGVHQFRGRNVNAPHPGSGRPEPGLGNVTQAESSAISSNHAVNVGLNWGRPGRFMFGLNYLLSKATHEADGPFALPADNFDLRGERGPALTDARHRFFMHANLTLYRGLRLGTVVQAGSASPYNITTGFDDNGDTVNNDRPAGVRRNSARGAGRADVGLRLGWGFGFGAVKEQPAAAAGPQIRIIRAGDSAGDILGSMPSLPGAENKRYRTEFYVQAYNLFNHANLTNFSGVQTSPFFGQATAALPGRRIETGVRFSF